MGKRRMPAALVAVMGSIDIVAGKSTASLWDLRKNSNERGGMQLGSPGRLGDQEPDDFCRDLGCAVFFFANLKKNLELEVERTNAGHHDPSLQIVMTTNEAQLKEPKTEIGQHLFSSRRIELANAKSGICTVALVISSPHVEVLMGDGLIRDSGQMMVFVVRDNSGTKAHRMDLEPLPYALHEMNASEIAKEIVAGVVRGRFE
jgi:hypothetical protein